MNSTVQSFSTKKILLLLSFAIAVLVLISSIGKPLLPPSTHLVLDDVDLVVASYNGSVIADDDLNRLIFVNPDGQIVNVKSFAADNIKADQANKVFISKDRVYVVAGQKLANGFYYQTERLLEYSLNGDFIREIYKIDQPSHKQKSFITLDNLRVGENNSLNLTYINENRLFFIDLNSNDNTPHFRVAFPEIIRHVLRDTNDSNSFLAYGLSGSCYYYDDKLKQITTLKREDAIKRYIGFHQLPDDTEYIFSNPDNMFPLTSISFRNNKIYYCDRFQELHQVKCGSKADTIIKELPYSNFMLLKIAAFWLSVAYLCLALLYFLFTFIFSIYNVVRTLNNTSHMDLKENPLFSKYVRDLLAILLIAATIIGFYTHSTFKSVNENYDKISQNQLQQITLSLEKYQSPLLKELAETDYAALIFDPVKRRQLIDFQAFLRDYSDAIGKDSGIYCEIYMHDQKGNCISIFDLTNIDMAGSINHELSKNWGDIQEENFRYDEETTAGTYCYFYQKLRAPDGKELGIIELGYLKDKLITEQQDKALNSFLNLLSLLILLYIIKEIVCVVRNHFISWQQLGKIVPEEAVAYMSGIGTVLINFVLLIDYIVYVYIMQEFCQKGATVSLATAAALNVFLNNAGYIIGPILTGYLLRFLSYHLLILGTGLGGIAGCIMMALSIPLNSLPLFFVGVLIKSCFIGGIDNTLYFELPLILKDDGKRFKLLQDNGRLDNMVRVVILVLSAFLAETAGYSALYYLAAIATALLTLVLLVSFRRRERTAVTIKTAVIQPDQERLFTSPEGISFIVGALFPYFILKMYAFMVFLVYAAENGISLLMLSNLTIISLFAFVFFTPPLLKFKDQLGRANTLLAVIIILSLLFICFFISPTIWWAIIALLIDAVLRTNADLWAYFSAMLESKKIDTASANRNLLTIMNIINTAVPSIVGFILPLGTTVACVFMGLCCLVLSPIFYFGGINYRSKI